MYPYYRDKYWCYIRSDEFEKIRWVQDTDGTRYCQFTHKNLKKTNAIKLGQIWVAKKFDSKGKPNPKYMPDTIEHFKKLPNGYVQIPVWLSWFLTDNFTLNYASTITHHPDLLRTSYDYQDDAINWLCARPVGLLHASTGSGKTQMICDVLTRLQRNTLIVVQNLTQMEQLVGDIQQILWVIPLQVSGRKPSKREQESWYPHITVCSIDSRDKVNVQDYWLILLDEADTYLGSDDRREWVGSLSPEYLYALTGTIKINHVDDNVFRLYYGPTTTLKLHHHTPKYKQVYSDFDFFYDGKFHELKAALYGDTRRNEFIVNTTLAAMAGRKVVVFTEYVEHAHDLSMRFKAHGKTVYTLVGEVAKDERERIRQEAKDAEGEVILVWSVDILGRWFDLPELSLAVLTVCEKFESSILQYIGRIIRMYEGKPDPVFIDIVDHLTPILMNQAKTRLRNFKKSFNW